MMNEEEKRRDIGILGIYEKGSGRGTKEISNNNNGV